MAIINMIKEEDRANYSNVREIEIDGNKILLGDSHVGLCVDQFERNGYNDSDFCMVVWDVINKQAKTIEFATTRFWSYPCYNSKVDASPEIIAEYKAWKVKCDRAYRIQLKWNRRKADMMTARELQLDSYHQVRKLRRIYKEDVEVIYCLLRVKKFRSKFRESLSNQIRTWLREDNPQYKYPLSFKQAEALFRR